MSTKGFFNLEYRLLLAVLFIAVVAGVIVFSNGPTGYQGLEGADDIYPPVVNKFVIEGTVGKNLVVAGESKNLRVEVSDGSGISDILIKRNPQDSLPYQSCNGQTKCVFPFTEALTEIGKENEFYAIVKDSSPRGNINSASRVTYTVVGKSPTKKATGEYKNDLSVTFNDEYVVRGILARFSPGSGIAIIGGCATRATAKAYDSKGAKVAEWALPETKDEKWSDFKSTDFSASDSIKKVAKVEVVDVERLGSDCNYIDEMEAFVYYTGSTPYTYVSAKAFHTPENPTVGDTVVITAQQFTANPTKQALELRIRLDGREVYSCEDLSIPCSYQTNSLSVGHHIYSAEAVESDTRLVRSSKRYGFDVVAAPTAGTGAGTGGTGTGTGTGSGGGTTDTTPPTVSVSISPVQPIVGQPVTFTATASDENGGSGLKEVRINVASVSTSPQKVCSESPCVYTKTYTGVVTRNNYYAYAVDNAGNIGRYPESGGKHFSVVVEAKAQSASPNTAPYILYFKTDKDAYDTNENVIFSVNAVDPEAKTLLYVIQYNLENNPDFKGSGQILPGDQGSEREIKLQSYSAPGDYEACLVVTDDKGVSSDRSCTTFTVNTPALDTTSSGNQNTNPVPSDTTPPAVSVSYSPQTPKFGDTIQVTATATDNVGVKSIDVYVVGAENAQNAVGLIGTCTFDTPQQTATCTKEAHKASGYNQLLFTARATDTSENKFAPGSQTIALQPLTTSAQLNLYNGWNLIALPGDFQATAASTCGKVENKDAPIIFLFDATAQDYSAEKSFANIKSPTSVDAQKGKLSAFWAYVEKNCNIKFDVTAKTVGLGKIKLVQGWNFVPVTDDMKGQTLAALGRNCNINEENIFGFDNRAQDWVQVGLDDRLTGNYNIVFYTSKACTLGDSTSGGMGGKTLGGGRTNAGLRTTR